MPFDSGPVSFTVCKMPKSLPEDAIERFQEKKGYSFETLLDDPQIGWVTGRHLLDTQIEHDSAYFGGYLYLFLRHAVRKIPPSLFKAECRIEELALMKSMNSVFISRKQKKEIKEAITERLLKEMPPTLTGTAFVLDSQAEILYLAATSQSKIDQFMSHIHETIGFEPYALTPETMAEYFFDAKQTSYPTLLISEKSSDSEEGDLFLGRDFLTWLWYFQEIEGGTFSVNDLGSFSIMVDGPLGILYK